MTTFEQRLKEMLSPTYDIERELGGGGMSRVFVATERSLGRKVVVKLLSPELTADVNRGRFRREIQVAAQLQHPHIVPLLSAGEHEDLLYFTMPFISGESLKSALEKHGRLEVPEVVRVLYDVAEALDYAHGQGVVHRDIKPANILRSGAYSLITDFGVAKALNASMPVTGMTSTGMAVGTPAYMAPEQLAGDSAADHRIDIYAIGLLAYELLNGKSPFAASTPQRILAAVLTQDPKPLIDVREDVPPSLSELVMRCLSKDPIERPPSAQQVLDSLDLFSTASGEIRTMEHKVPRAARMTPTAPLRATPASNDTGSTEVQTSTGQMQASTGQMQASTGQMQASTGQMQSPTGQMQTSTGQVQTSASQFQQTGQVQLPTAATYSLSGDAHDLGYIPPKKSRSKLIAGIVAILALVAIGAFFKLQGDGSTTFGVTTSSMDTAALVADSAGAQAPLTTTATPESAVVAAPLIDSVAIKDSIRKARREAAKKAAAAAAAAAALDSAAQRAQQSQAQSPVARARGAVAKMLADPPSLRIFTRGATHMGGVLGKQRRGDLQTQINALVPYLTDSGVTYEQFKAMVQQSGIKLFDEFGRMVPDSLQKFASGSH